MALTKVQTIGIETGISLAGVTTVVTLNASGNVTAVDGTFTGNVSVAGTLTYEDVTNVDSVGLITARNGVSVTGGDFKVGSATTISQDNIFTTGIVTATSFYGDGSNLTGIDATQIVTGDTSVQTTDTGSDGTIKFNTDGSERARIDSSGRFGLGTTTVARGPLHLHTSGDTQLHMTNSTTGATDGDGFTIAVSGSEALLVQREVAPLSFYTAQTERARIDSSGNFGLGTASPTARLDVRRGDTDGLIAEFHQSGGYGIDIGSSQSVAYISSGYSQSLAFKTDPSSGQVERARIDSSGRLLVGATSARTNIAGGTQGVLVEGSSSTNSQNRFTEHVFNANNTEGPYLGLAKTRSTAIGGNAIVQSGDYLGGIYFHGNDGSDFKQSAKIEAQVDGTPGTNDMPGRITFSTTPDGDFIPVERMRINSTGFLKVSNTGSYISSTGAYHEFRSNDASNPVVYLTQDSTSYGSDMLFFRAEQASSSGYYFMVCRNSGISNNAILLRGDGNAYADGSWNGGGADYAEYFEWSDGNTASEDRRGISVVLDSGKIREAVAGEEPIGVISGNPSVVGDADVNQWKHKHLRDEYGSFVLDENGERQLNPDYDPDIEYVSREDRPEWDCVGLMGKLRIRKGQVTGSRWIKMRDISDSVEEWLVR